MRLITVLLLTLAFCISLAAAEQENDAELLEDASEEEAQLQPEQTADKRFDIFKKHGKRGLYSTIPTFSQGIDYPVVKHSYLKSFIVDYPKKSIPLGVKVPFKGNMIHIKFPPKPGHHYPGHHGQQVPTIQNPVHIPSGSSNPGWSPTNCPHPPSPTVPALIPENSVPAITPLFPVKPLIPLPSFNFPVLPRPVLPLPSPLIPVAPRPLIPIASRPLFSFPTPLVPILPRPVLKPLIPVNHALPLPAPVFPSPTPILPAAPVAPIAPLLPNVLRPGNSIQTSYFATFPKFPIGHRPLHLIPQPHVTPLPLAPVPHLKPLVPVTPLPLAPFPLKPAVQVPVQFPLGLGTFPGAFQHFPQQFVPETAGTDVHATNVDNNVWTPMVSPNGDSGLHPETSENHDHHQGYHYQPNGHQPFVEGLHSQHYYEQLRHQEEERQFQEEQQYLSASQQAQADPQHAPQLPQAFPTHHLSGRPIVETFGNIFPTQQTLPLRRPLHGFSG